MPYKLVTRDVILSIQGESYYISEQLISAKPVPDIIQELRERGYCASERALADIGFPPVRAKNSNGNNIFVVKVRD